MVKKDYYIFNQKSQKSFLVSYVAFLKNSFPIPLICHKYVLVGGTAVAQWLRCCATNWKVAGLIPVGVIGFFVLPIAL